MNWRFIVLGYDIWALIDSLVSAPVLQRLIQTSLTHSFVDTCKGVLYKWELNNST